MFSLFQYTVMLCSALQYFMFDNTHVGLCQQFSGSTFCEIFYVEDIIVTKCLIMQVCICACVQSYNADANLPCKRGYIQYGTYSIE